MIIGNQEGKSYLQQYLTKRSDFITSKAGFFLLYGPANIGKHSFAVEFSKEYLGEFFSSGFLHIQDFSGILGKKHSIKVESNVKSEEYSVLYNQHSYKDLGVREINAWLQQSSFGGEKVLLIENIDRMTIEATNAFLKVSEEPLPQRLIIATSSNKLKILDTIVSRAFSIPFFPLSKQEMLAYVDQEFGNIDTKIKDLLLEMSMGRPGVVNNFAQKIQDNPSLEKDIQRALVLLSKDGKIIEKFQILERFSKSGILEQFIDARIAYSTKHHLYKNNKRLKMRSLLQSNIKQESAILYSILS